MSAGASDSRCCLCLAIGGCLKTAGCVGSEARMPVTSAMDQVFPFLGFSSSVLCDWFLFCSSFQDRRLELEGLPFFVGLSGQLIFEVGIEMETHVGITGSVALVWRSCIALRSSSGSAV